MIYMVVEAGSLRELEKQVNDYLKQGYKLQGGISYSPCHYFQAMTLDLR